MNQNNVESTRVHACTSAAFVRLASSRTIHVDHQRLLQSFLHSRYAPLITHISVVTLTVFMFGLLLWAPLWIAILPCLLMHYRVGILLHEYIHGIPFRRYKHNLWMLSLFDELLIFFGFLELFRK